MRQLSRTKLYIIIGLLLFVGVAIFQYAKSSTASEASLLFNTMEEKVDNNLRFYTVNPQETAQGGVIVFPDDHEDPNSYALMAKSLAAMGLEVRVARYPLGRSSFKTDYSKILSEDKQMSWVSIGVGKGANKACFLGDQSTKVKGLFLIGSCSSEVNLNDNDLQITMYQIESNPISEDQMQQIIKKLPADTKFKVVASKDQVFGQLMGSIEESQVSSRNQKNALSEEIYQILVAQPILTENGD